MNMKEEILVIRTMCLSQKSY